MNNWKDSIQKRRPVDTTRMRDMLIQISNQWLNMLDKDIEDSAKVDRMRKNLKHLRAFAEANPDSENIKW